MSQIHPFLGRRELLKLGSTGVLGVVTTACGLVGQVKQVQADASPTTQPPLKPPAKPSAKPLAKPTSLSPDTALQKLLEGNQRFAKHQPQHPDQSESRVQEVAQSQHPFATILSCADSRVPAEIIFDRGIGDIFDVRIAGNIVTPEALGSIEYAVSLLNSPLLMVLGHERCGAVTAAVKNEALPGDISTFVKAIQPAVKRVKSQAGDAVDNAVVANVSYQIERLQRSQLLRQRVKTGQLKIVGGRYDLDTGKVTLIT